MSSAISGPKDLPDDTYVAGGAILKHRGVKRGADLNTVVLGTAGTSTHGDLCLGVSYDDQDTTGRTVPVTSKPGKKVYGEAGAAFALDAALKTNASGQFIGAATTGDIIVAYARQAATAAAQYVVIEIAGKNQLVP
jgi:hypothetical protein